MSNGTVVKIGSEGPRKAQFIALALILILVWWAIYFKTLFWGYKEDDVELLKLSWQEWLHSPLLVTKGRPLWGLSYLLTNEMSSSPLFQRGVNLCLLSIIICLFVWYIYQRRMSINSCFFLVAALAHPSFIWPITWIAQRNDLLLILFIALNLLALRRSWSVICSILAAAAKTPFVFQNIFFAWRYFCAGRSLSGALALLSVPIFIYAGYKTYYMENLEQPVKYGLYAINRHDLIFTAESAAVRAAKMLEGLFYSFVPLSAFAVSSTHVIAAACILLFTWGVVMYEIAKYNFKGSATWPGISAIQNHPSFDLLTIGLLLCVPYGFGTGLRIYSPALIFLFLGIAAMAPATKVINVCLAMIAATYFLGVYLNYDANAGPCFFLHHLMEECNGPATPDSQWEELRQSAVDKFVHRYLSISH